MSTKREDEMNEKIIRGLLKLPPNRRCINCNNLGPQYVCTDFWTFVCMTCSGIHREFTHRVKSVSMATFTKQEVEALQSGGNQRARDLFLKEWDMNQRRLPDSSNAVRIREFIKDVYVNKKYYERKSSGEPSTDTEGSEDHEDLRRTSSYHSFSQSPPYDYQYEERRYGKQFGMLTRNPGSDKNRCLAKTTSDIYSPDQRHGQIKEDLFLNESCGSIMYVHSPNSQSPGYGSPLVFPSKDSPVEDKRSQMPNRYIVRSASSSGFPFNASQQDTLKLYTTRKPEVTSPLDLLSGSDNVPPPTNLSEQKSSGSMGQPSSTNLFEEITSSVSLPLHDCWATFDIDKQFGFDATDDIGTSISGVPGTEATKVEVVGVTPQQSDIYATENLGTSAPVLSSNMPSMGTEDGFTQNYPGLFVFQNVVPGGAFSVMHGQWPVDPAEHNKLVPENISQLWNTFDGSSAVEPYAPVVSQPQFSFSQVPGIGLACNDHQYNLSLEEFQSSVIDTAAENSE